MTSKIKIYELWLSFIWVETVLDFLDKSPPPNAPMRYLGRSQSYAEQFQNALNYQRKLLHLNKPADQEDPHVPWPRPSGDFFWTYYLEGRKPGSATGNQAWKLLVPLRAKRLAQVKAQWLPGRIIPAAYYYPHGFAIIVNIVCQTKLTLDEAVDKAFEIRRTGKLRVKWEGNKTYESLSLKAFADKGLARVGRLAMGSKATSGLRSVTPFSVATVARGSGVDPKISTPAGGEVHRALEAMTTWRPTWRYDPLSNIDAASLSIRTAPHSHIHYGQKRGRVVWFPGLFVQQTKGFRSLSCYHRNIVHTSLQVESLSHFVLKTAEEIQNGTKLSAAHRECARRAVGVLGRLYGGDYSTYRSWSTRFHIEQNNLANVINQVRDRFNLSPLS